MTACDGLFDHELASCVGSYTNDLNDCYSFTNVTNQDQCLRIYAQTIQSIETCSLINSQNESDICYHYIAAETDNLEICENIKEEYRKDNCEKGAFYFRKKPYIQNLKLN